MRSTSKVAIFLILALYTSLIGGEPVPLSTDLYKKLDQIYTDFIEGRSKKINLAQSERSLLTNYLKEIYHDKKSIYDRVMAERVLVELGDDEAIASSVSAFLQDSNDRDFLQSSNPKVIIAAAPYLFNQEAYRPLYGSDTVKFQTSFAAMFGIKAHLATSPYYTPEVNYWAGHIKVPEQDSAEKKREFERNMMRRWWTANKAAFLRGDYLAVKPGETYPENESAPSPSAAPPEPDFGKSTPASTPQRSLAKMAKPVALAPQFPVGPLVALFLALLGASAAYLLWRRKR